MSEFRDIYERHHQAVYRLALFLSGNVGAAEDLAAETFARAWMARARIRPQTVRAYLLTITRNLYRDQLRERRPPLVGLDERTPDTRPGVDVRVEQTASLERVRQRLRGVARGDRRALLLYVFREMSYADIAATLGVSVGAVKSRISRARDALRTPEPVLPNGDER
jgi:RNA polymerase sigma factor (sigma-70 family)